MSESMIKPFDGLARPAAQRGFALVESLVALLILSMGILALAQLQARMTQHSDHARQRVHAMTGAQEQLERFRASADRRTLAPEPGFDAIADGKDSMDGATGTIERQWRVRPAAGAKSIQLQLQWLDREGRAQTVQLRSLIAPDDAVRAALLTSPLAPAQTQFGADGRPAGVPLQAVPLAGSSRWYRMAVPRPGGSSLWLVFDARTSDVAYRCVDAPASEAALSACTAEAGRWVSGTVHLGSGVSMGAIRLLLSDDREAACAQSTLQGLVRTVGFSCLTPVQDHDRSSRTPPVWSGRLEFSAQSGAGESVRVCRYAHNASQSDGRYVDVDQSLLHQNHLLSTEVCPAGTAEQR